MKLLPYGPGAVLAEFDSLAQVMTANAAWTASPPTGVRELVPAARTVLIRHDETFDPATLVAPAEGDGIASATTAVVEIAVDYSGEDLAAVATATGLTVEEVVALHSGATYTVAFCGFMPGFGYLVGMPPQLHLPRRATPRTRVQAGSVAIAGEFAAVYPRDSPGGWHLLGHTEVALWDDAAEPPALLQPGTTVRFTPR